MAKLPVIQPVTEGFGAFAQLNANFISLQQAFLNVLSRDGATPNNMDADLDLDLNDILNVNELDARKILLNGVDLAALTGDLTAIEELLASYVTNMVFLAYQVTVTENFNTIDTRLSDEITDVNERIDNIPSDLASVFYPMTGGTLGGPLTTDGRIDARTVVERHINLGNASPVTSLDFANGSSFSLNLLASTNLVFTNAPNIERVFAALLQVYQAGSNAIGWPANCLFEDGTPPPAPGVGKTSVYAIYTFNGGVSYNVILVAAALE